MPGMQKQAASQFDSVMSGAHNARENETVSKPLAKNEDLRCEPPGSRTQNLLIKSQLLCQLS